jgi:hypothetical protein
MELLLPLFAGGFLLGLLVGRWWTVLISIPFGVFMWGLWSADAEVDAVAIGLVFGVNTSVGTAIGFLVRSIADSKSALRRSRPQWGRWARLIIGLEPKDPPQPPNAPDRGLDRPERPS